MIDCMKKYKMVLTDEDGNVYKSDSVDITESRGYNIEKNGQMAADMHLIAWGFKLESAAGTPPGMPTAEEARLAVDVIREEKRKKVIAEEWNWLIGLVRTAVRDGNEYVKTGRVCDENKWRLIELGYDVRKEDRHWRIGWIESEFMV